jgi:uncharacterized protein (DUF2147 family)
MLRFASFLLAGLLVATDAAPQSQTQGDGQSPTPVGIWMHPNKRIQIEIAPCGEQLCGTLVWLQKPNDPQGAPLVDSKNKSPALRTRPLLGLSVLSGLRRTGDNSWEDGRIYNPEDGSDYDAQVSLQDDSTLLVRASVLHSLFGKTIIWSRVTQTALLPDRQARAGK